MAIFRDPLKGFPAINPANALDVNLENFRNLPDAKTDFLTAIDKLVSMRNVFLVARAAGYIDQIPYWPHFQNILQWLNKESDLGPYQSTPRIVEYVTIDDSQAAVFLSNVNNLEANCIGSTEYKLSSTVLGAISTQKMINVQPNIDSIINTEEDRLNAQRSEFESLILKTQEDLTVKVTDEKATALNEIQKSSDEKLAAIRQADALKEWQEHYEELLGPISKSITAHKWLTRNENDNNIQVTIKFLVRPLLNIISLIKTALLNLFNRLFPSTSGYAAMTDQYKLWKNVWLSMLVLAEATLTFLFTSLWKWDYKTQFAQIFAYKLIVALFFGALYVSANKNYRIYANLTDQVKHRSVVAKTIRGIVVDQSIGDANSSYKAELVIAGAKAMFEMKNTGHLSKKESASPVFDMLRDTTGK